LSEESFIYAIRTCPVTSGIDYVKNNCLFYSAKFINEIAFGIQIKAEE